MSEVFFTSDHHFGHTNIIKHTNRPFKNANQMNERLIAEWNTIVRPDDVVYHLGDFAWGNNAERIGSFIKRLNGNKHLVLGNHDKLKPFSYVEAGFLSVHTSLEFNGIYLAHDPAVKVALQKGDWLIHGHIHNLWKIEEDKKLINVSVEVWDYKPVMYETLRCIIKE